MLSRFWPLMKGLKEGGGGGGGGLSESIKKGKFRTKIFFFQIILDEVEKICGK